jgi:uncharacterized membrane protein YciS (DUF1049 family)
LRFLNLLFWLIIVALVTSLAVENWRDVTINLWGNLQADIKIPVLLAFMFLIGWLPAYILYRTRLWQVRRATPAATLVRMPADNEEPE